MLDEVGGGLGSMPSDVGHGLAVHAPMSRDFGDPIAMLIGPGATELDIAHLRRLFGLRAGRRHRPPVRLLPAGSRRPGRRRDGVIDVRSDSATLDVALRWNGTEIRCRTGETVAVALLCAGRLNVPTGPGSPPSAARRVTDAARPPAIHQRSISPGVLRVGAVRVRRRRASERPDPRRGTGGGAVIQNSKRRERLAKIPGAQLRSPGTC